MEDKEEIDLHLLRERAKKDEDITDEMFLSCNQINIDMYNEYFSMNAQLSQETKKQYMSCLRNFFYYNYKTLGNKPYYNISKRDFARYYNHLIERNLSSSAILLRKSACSSFCNYIESMVAEDVPEAKNFRNFTRNMATLERNRTYEKIAVTKEEYTHIMEELEKRENYLGMAWVATAFNTGARRAEIIQFKTEILTYPIIEGKNYIMSHIVRGKGKSVDGKPLRYMIPIIILPYLQKWVDTRGYESEYIFTNKAGEQLSKTWADDFCEKILSPICGRRINCHLWKNSTITHLLSNGVDMKFVSKYIAHHESIETTDIYDLRNFEEEKDKIFDKF